MTKAVVPTIGRIINYVPTKHDNGNIDEDSPMIAIVTYVHDENTVNLSVLSHDGSIFGKSNVVMVDEDQEAEAGQCEWAEHQKE